MRILGVDPGSRLTGYGCIDVLGGSLKLVGHGTLKLSNTHGKATVPLEERLHSLHLGLSRVIRELRPEILVIERVFFAKNAVSALKLGQARGAAILTGMIHALKIFEYSPTEVKRAVVGQGHADKDQVARMVELCVGRQRFETSDASDAVALAICHAQMTRRSVSSGMPRTTLHAAPGRRTKKTSSLAEALGIDVELAAGHRRISADKLR